MPADTASQPTDPRPWLRAARAWVCYRLVLALPIGWRGERVRALLLPHAGDWAYADDQRAIGRDPWGDRRTWHGE